MTMRKAQPAEKRTAYRERRSLLFASFPWSLGAVAVALLMALALTPRISAQNPSFGAGGFPRGQLGDSGSPLAGDTGNAQMEAKRLDALNTERQKALVSDTNKSLKLTAELNAQINAQGNGTHPASLTQAQLRMVAEIEKLARNIREKMCTGVKGVPQMGAPLTPIMPSPLP